MKWTRSRTATVLAVGTASALLLSACSTDTETPTSSAPEPSASQDKTPLTLNVQYWGNFGLESLVDKYTADHPWVTIKLNSGDFAAQHDALQQAIIAGSGANEVVVIDEGYMTGFVAQSDAFVNLLDLGAGQYQENY